MRDGFNATELTRLNSVTPAELKDGGYSAQECKAAGVSARDAGFLAAELNYESFSAAECKALGYSVEEVRGMGRCGEI